MSVTAPAGFVGHGVAAGIKPSGDTDLALVATAEGRAVPCAAVFTQNRSTAAPVVVSRDHLRSTGGRAAAVVLNAGNANAATGAAGLEAAERMAMAVAIPLGCAADEVLVCSTGLIGIQLPVERVEAAAPALVDGRTDDGGDRAARAILTTDTTDKQVAVTREGHRWTIGGMAKGAAMLAPNMATMLAVLTTDAAVAEPALRQALGAAVDRSFNALCTDGCTSTNDTVIVLAGGAAGEPSDLVVFGQALAEACADLALAMAGDAEGATKVVRMTVRGAASHHEARIGAAAVARSALCKCSWYGADPYWGRIAAELGAAGIAFEPDRLSVSYGGVAVCRGGIASPHDAEQVADHMAGRELHIVADLGIGIGRFTALTNDLTHAYIDENMGTS